MYKEFKYFLITIVSTTYQNDANPYINIESRLKKIEIWL